MKGAKHIKPKPKEEKAFYEQNVVDTHTHTRTHTQRIERFIIFFPILMNVGAGSRLLDWTRRFRPGAVTPSGGREMRRRRTGRSNAAGRFVPVIGRRSRCSGCGQHQLRHSSAYLVMDFPMFVLAECRTVARNVTAAARLVGPPSAVPAHFLVVVVVVALVMASGAHGVLP